MMRSIRSGRGLGLAASGAVLALGLALCATACGSQGNDPTATSSADWSKGATSANPAQSFHHILPPIQITDCSMAEYVGIFSAFNTAQIDASQLALSVSKDSDVLSFAQQMLTDDEDLASRLSAWMTSQGVTAMDSEFTNDIKLVSDARLTQLRGDPNFDRDFVMGEIGGHWMLQGFFQSVGFAQDFSSGGMLAGSSGMPGSATDANANNGVKQLTPEQDFQAIILSATQLVQQHLALAFQVESKLVGMCGVAPAVVTVPDAGASDDAGSPSDGGCSVTRLSDAGACSSSRW